MNPIDVFNSERTARVAGYGQDEDFKRLSRQWLQDSMQRMYVYNFSWMGRPIIQYPQDMVAIQELIWSVKPDLIIETGIAHGGSLILSASMLAMLDYCEAIENGTAFDPRQSRRKVLGVDIDIRPHNRAEIERHPLSHLIAMIEGSSIAPETVEQVQKIAAKSQRIMVFLDSMHTDSHVFAELNAYATLVSSGSYCVVFDTFVEHMPPQFFANRPWDVGNNPKTAVGRWLAQNPDFTVDEAMEQKLMVTVAPGGFLRREESL